MARTREAHEKIRDAVTMLGGQGSFSEFKKETGLGHNTLALNLFYLRELGELERIEVPDIENPKRKRIVWRATDSFWKTQTRKNLEEIINEPLPLYFSRPSEFTPYFELGYSDRASYLGTRLSLDDVVFQRFNSEIEDMLFGEHRARRETVLGFAARCIWRGYLRYLEWAEKDELMREIQEIKKLKGARLEPLAKNLEALLKAKIHEENGQEDLARYLMDGLNEVVGSSPLMDYQMRHLCLSLVELLEPGRTFKVGGEITKEYAARFEYDADELVKTIPIDEKKNEKWLSTHKKEFLGFLKEVGKIRFAYIVAFGFEGTKKLERLDVVRQFEEWFEDLKEGVADHRFSIFKGTERVLSGKQVLENTIYRLENGKEPRKKTKIDWKEQWIILDLYRHHPRGKEVDFYKSILGEIKKRLPKARKKFRDFTHPLYKKELEALEEMMIRLAMNAPIKASRRARSPNMSSS